MLIVRCFVFVVMMQLLMVPARANLILGGGFNSATELSDNWTTGAPLGGALPVATIGPAFGLAPQAGAGYLGYTGNNGFEDGFVRQDVAVKPGLHTLSFYYGTRGLVGGAVTVTVTDSSAGELISQEFIASAVGDWTFVELGFIAPSDLITVQFQETSATSVNRGPGIDTVVLTAAVPEPATIMVLGLGLLGMWRLRKRR